MVCLSVIVNPTECGMSECNRESSITRKPWPTGGLLRHGKKYIYDLHLVGIKRSD